MTAQDDPNRIAVYAHEKDSVTGTRTRVSRVRAVYPNQLDYDGLCDIVLTPYNIRRNTQDLLQICGHSRANLDAHSTRTHALCAHVCGVTYTCGRSYVGSTKIRTHTILQRYSTYAHIHGYVRIHTCTQVCVCVHSTHTYARVYTRTRTVWSKPGPEKSAFMLR